MIITYSLGLGVRETARLKMTDIDSKRMMVRIRGSKGGKDRYSILVLYGLCTFKRILGKISPAEWFFEGAKKSDHITTHAIQLVFYAAKAQQNDAYS